MKFSPTEVHSLVRFLILTKKQGFPEAYSFNNCADNYTALRLTDFFCLIVDSKMMTIVKKSDVFATILPSTRPCSPSYIPERNIKYSISIRDESCLHAREAGMYSHISSYKHHVTPERTCGKITCPKHVQHAWIRDSVHFCSMRVKIVQCFWVRGRKCQHAPVAVDLNSAHSFHPHRRMVDVAMSSDL